MGAAGYVFKRAPSEELVSAVLTTAANGVLPLEPSIKQHLETQRDSALSEREAEILAHVAKGAANKVIASELDISENTVRNHMAKILGKLDARDRTEAVVIALNQGMIEP